MTDDERFHEIASIAGEAGDFYEKNMYALLKEKCAEIQKKLDEIVDRHAAEFKLVHQNDSSKIINLYALTSRVKSKSSLTEKIVRKQQFYNLKGKKGDALKEEILRSNDDLIGLRYLVSLSCDCYSLHGLLKEYREELSAENIIFSNLDSNPEFMNNGRYIFRLKGTYTEETPAKSRISYPFELQIKSKIDSAWADEEHMLFYKENHFSYPQKSNRIVMNQIGAILEEVDKLMVQIRECQNDSSQEEAEELEFNRKLETRYLPYLNETLSNTFILKEHRKTLFRYYQKQSASRRKLIYQKMDESTPIQSFRKFNPDQDLAQKNIWNNYQALKEYSIEYVLFEHIYVDWMTGNWIKEKDTYSMYPLRGYISGITKCAAETVLGEMADDPESLTEFAKWFGGELVSTLYKRDLTFRAPLFIFDANRMYILFCYWKVLSQRLLLLQENENYSNDTESKDPKALNTLVIRYLLDSSDPSRILTDLKKLKSKAIKSTANTVSGALIKYVFSADFMKDLDKEYHNKEKSNTGKQLKEDMILKLFEQL